MSYISLDDAKLWIAAHIQSKDRTAWDALQDADKQIALRDAEDAIDALPLRGSKYDTGVTAGVPDQPAQFPRIIDGVTLDWNDSTNEAIVPQVVKDAVCHEAVATCQGGERRTLQTQGVQSFSIGGKLSETFRPGAGSEMLASEKARKLMRRYMGAEIR